MTWVMAALAVVFILDALRLRGRISALHLAGGASGHPQTPPPAQVPGGAPAGGAATEPEALKFSMVQAHDAAVSDAARRAAAAFARSEGLTVVDLVPARWTTPDAMALAQLVDTRSYRSSRFIPGRSAGVATLVADDVLERAGERAGRRTPAQLALLAKKLKRYAPVSMDFAAVEGLTAPEMDGASRYALFKAVVGGGSIWMARLGIPFIFGLIVWGFVEAPLWAAAALVAWHLQPLLSLAGQQPACPDLVLSTIGRLPLELRLWATTFLRRDAAPAEDRVLPKRPEYQQLMAGGVEPFFEERRPDCPICGSTELRLHLQMGDIHQGKPGRFKLDRCTACGHIFQNPRLSLDGLNFYYKDFYDGLGGDELDAIFAFSAEPYLARARVLRGHAEPRRWLDVGAGHGHFCCAARDVFPSTSFDGLDLSESIEEAYRHRWVDRGYRGLFPDLAGTDELPAASYDVVSMSHYLEHTREPRDEIAAAHRVLTAGGHLLIEVPDPECRTGRLLGRYWLPWFQPQHQHLLPVGLLETLLKERGFTPVLRHRGEAHQPVDMMFAAFMLLSQLSPPANKPWRRVPILTDRLRTATVWTLGIPLLGLAWLTDRVTSPLLRRPGWSNTYRVLARKD